MDRDTDADDVALRGIVAGSLYWLVELFLPPLRYWTVFHNSHERVITIRQRLHPGVEKTCTAWGLITLDGPHETQDEAARRLAFWKAQYEEGDVSDDSVQR